MHPKARRRVYAFLALLSLTGCGASPSAVADSKNGQDSTVTPGGDNPGGIPGNPGGNSNNPDGPGNVGGDHAKDPAYSAPARFTIQLGHVGALSKGASIFMRRMMLMAISNAIPADTVRDTAILDAASGQTVKRLLKLKPKAAWVLQARTFDTKDSLVHSGITAPFTAKPGDTTDISLSLPARFVMYQALFGSLPSTVNSAPDGIDRVPVNISRVTLKIDGAVKADSAAAAGFFLPGQDVALSFDYVNPGVHAVTLEAYGQVGSFQGLLFSGTGTFASNAGEDASKPIALVWAGPNTGVGRFSVILGRIGQVTVTGGFANQL